MFNGLRKAFALPAIAAATAVLPLTGAPAQAEDAQTITTSSSSITHDQELALLRQASDDSQAHAEAGFNIGLVLHVGDDINAAQLPLVVDYYKDMYQKALDEAYPDQGGVVQVFVSPNPGTPASGFHANIGDGIFQVPLKKYGLDPDSDPSLMGLVTTREVIPDLLEVLPAAKVLQTQNEANARTASLTSFTPTGLN